MIPCLEQDFFMEMIIWDYRILIDSMHKVHDIL
jgi:hypothetical protein